MVRSYKELKRLATFEERFEYLALRGSIGRSTFGFDRYLNQQLYTSREWRQLRPHIITRDLGCDLGIDGYEIHNGLYIHHMNPINVESVVNKDPAIFDPEFLITTTHQTHNAIHFGNANLLPKPLVERRPGDTKLW
jgi:hypothetical protein